MTSLSRALKLAAPWVLIALGVALIIVASCRPTGGGADGVTRAGVVSCTTTAVRDNWPRAYPAVMHCLVSITSAPIACLDALPEALRVGVDVVACIVRGVDREAAMRGPEGPDDAVTVRKTERARAWLDHRGLRFDDAPTPDKP